MTNWTAAASFVSIAAPSSDRTNATASKIWLGVPANCPSAFRLLPSDRVAPPIFGATKTAFAPASVTSAITRSSVAASDPSA